MDDAYAEREGLSILSKRHESWHGGHETVLPWRILLADGNEDMKTTAGSRL